MPKRKERDPETGVTRPAKRLRLGRHPDTWSAEQLAFAKSMAAMYPKGTLVFYRGTETKQITTADGKTGEECKVNADSIPLSFFEAISSNVPCPREWWETVKVDKDGTLKDRIVAEWTAIAEEFAVQRVIRRAQRKAAVVRKRSVTWVRWPIGGNR